MGQMPEPVSWSFSAKETAEDEITLTFKADIDKGWTVYSQYLDEGGPFPTTITYESDVNLIGEASEKGNRKEGMDPFFDMNVIKFLDDQPYVIQQKIKKSGLKAISGYLTFMTCDDKRCLPPTDIEFSIPIKSTKVSVPQKSNQSGAAIEKSESIKQTKVSEKDKPELKWVVVPKDNMPVQWSYALNPLSENSYELKFKADIDDGWTVYSQFIEDGGPFPTTIFYDNKEGIELVGLASEAGKKKEGLDPIFDMNVIKFFHGSPYTLTQQITVNDPQKPLNGLLTYMCCDDEKCLPPTDVEFTFDLIKEVAGSSPEDSVEDNIIVNAGQENIINQVRPKLRESFAEPISSCGFVQEANKNIWLMFFFGFVGGLLALLTPCVFPMIPLTVSFFTKDSKRKGWWNGTLYGISIIVIYVTIGLLITALFGEEALNSLSTNWIANTLFFLIFVFFAFSFFGFYEITLPSSWANSSDKMADRGGLIGIFFMAFTLALVSFSCTGPLIGTALVQAASNQVGPFIVMFGFSLALALPFGLFAAFPAWLNSLPKSGGWMNSVKVILGFLELALAFKFLTVADLTSHWGLLKYEVFVGIWIVIALAMAAYGFGMIKFPHDSPVTKITTTRWVFSLASIAFAIYLATGFIYDDNLKSYRPLGALSGLAPPVNYNLFLDPPKVDEALKSKYPSFGKCANNIDCFKDYFEGLAYAQEVNKPMLIDHTGHGCVNCRRTEDRIWSDDRIRNMLNNDFVLVSLYVDDREELDEILISESRNKKLRTVGSKWADFQIVNFDQISQPLYVLVTPEEEVISPPREYREGIQGYLDFLECGLETFETISMN